MSIYPPDPSEPRGEAEAHLLPDPGAAPRYVCENCGRLGPIASFSDDCKPGWTHGRLIKVTAEVILPLDEGTG